MLNWLMWLLAIFLIAWKLCEVRDLLKAFLNERYGNTTGNWVSLAFEMAISFGFCYCIGLHLS